MIAEYRVKYTNGSNAKAIVKNVPTNRNVILDLKSEDISVVNIIKGMWLGVTNAIPDTISSAEVEGSFGVIVSRGDFKKANNNLKIEDFCFIDMGYDAVNINVFYENESAKNKLNGFYLAGVDVTHEMLLKLNMVKSKVNKVLKVAQLEGNLGKEVKDGEKQFGLYHKTTGKSLNLTDDELEGYDYALIRTILSLLLYDKKIRVVFINAEQVEDREYLSAIADIILSLSDKILLHVYNNKHSYKDVKNEDLNGNTWVKLKL